MKQTFFFYDLETSGLSPRKDRIMQFAGQRTDMELNPIGKPYNILIKLSNDTLPNPKAISVTKILPQKTVAEGIGEVDFCRILTDEIFTPNTIATGYNSIRFDDEFIRFLFWRNFHDPYTWQWKDGRSRWDLLDVVRMVRAIRPSGINWPIDEEGNPTNRLELITKINQIDHFSAHDAMSDVEALISVTKLIKQTQPKMFQYLLEMRDKNLVAKLVNLNNPQPFIYTSGRYLGAFNKTTVAIPLMPGKNGAIFVFDLRYNIEELLQKTKNSDGQPLVNTWQKVWPAIKDFRFNKCPAVAPLSVMKSEDYTRIGLSSEIVKNNLAKFQKNSQDLIDRLSAELAEKEEKVFTDSEPEANLYDGFLGKKDELQCRLIRELDENSLANYQPTFDDNRMESMLLNYKGRNFPSALSEAEEIRWKKFRKERIGRMEVDFLNNLQDLDSDSEIFRSLDQWYWQIKRSLISDEKS